MSTDAANRQTPQPRSGTVARGAPARYFPPANGRYEIKAGFSRLGSDFGNGTADGRLFQIDRQFSDYRAEKLRSRKERYCKYIVSDRPDPSTLRAAANLMVRRLCHEHPEFFILRSDSQGSRLECALTGDVLTLDGNLNLVRTEAARHPDPAYDSTLDALACQIQEDIALLESGPRGDRVTLLHVCFPNHWAPADKIGQDFATVHEPVAGFGPIVRRHHALVRAMVERGPFVRFAWGLVTDARLNHHPDPPAGVALAEWVGRRFDPAHPALYLRVERQTLWGLPQAHGCLFAIRTYLTDCRDLTVVQLRQLRAALATMTAESRTYKGLADSDAAIRAWIDAASHNNLF